MSVTPSDQWTGRCSCANRFQHNIDRCKELRVSLAMNKPVLPPLTVNGHEVKVAGCAKFSARCHDNQRSIVEYACVRGCKEGMKKIVPPFTA